MNSPNIIKRAAATTRIDTRDSWSKCATTAAGTTTGRSNLPSLAPATAKKRTGDIAGLKVLERDASLACASISPHKKMMVHVDAAPATPRTDRVLTFLQSARAQNVPVRAGKWNPEEDAYLRKLVDLFSLGVLDGVAQKSSMRAWLSRMLNCCPMRISKKQMNGAKFLGKAKFNRNVDAINNMTQAQYDATCDDVSQLRANFLIHWAKDEFAKRTTKDMAMSFDEWYAKALDMIPRPQIAAHDQIVAAPLQQRPELESIDAVHEQLQLERATQHRQRVAVAAAAMPLSRCYKRQRVSCPALLDGSDYDDRMSSDTHFQDLLTSFPSPCMPLAALSLESCFNACTAEVQIDSYNSSRSSSSGSSNGDDDDDDINWLLEICAEPSLEVFGDYIDAATSSQRHERLVEPTAAPGAMMTTMTGTTKEPEDEFQCHEVLSPSPTDNTTTSDTLQFDFGVPSKWETSATSTTDANVLEFPSCGTTPWSHDDMDLLLDGFAILSDQSLVLWDDSDIALDSYGHTVLASANVATALTL